ncbi:MAG: response regulator [Candidatus Rokubacteria bacterium]|nr:response regulator [Candidatus Rokubacteria bacterium]
MRQALRILIVEDSEDDAWLVVRELVRSGYEPSFRRVETEAEMEAALRAGPWDVVVADHALPAFDSLSALALLARHGVEVPFIIVSGAMSEEAAVAAMRAGAHDYISKGAYGRLVPAIERELREFAERRNAQDAERRRQREAEALALIARETTESLALDALTQRLADRVIELFDAASSTVRLKAADGSLVAIALAGAAAANFTVGHRIAPSAGVVGRAAAEGRILWTPDVLEDTDFALTHEVREEHRALGHRAVLAAPLRAGDEILGTLAIADTRPRRFADEEITFFQALADQAALAVRNGQLLASEQAARTEAERLNRAKDEFLAMLAHELRNPLGAIVAAVGVLDRLAQPQDAAVRSRHVIRRQTQHLKRLVDDLLDVARVTTGKIALSLEPLDLGEAVRACVLSLADARRLDQHQLDLDVESVPVRADATRVEQVTVNLLDNAIKHTPSGGTITVRVRRDGDEAVLAIRDTGRGISPELLPRVFDLFTQGARGLDRTEGGLGVGLTLVRGVVQQHGGRVEARSEGPGRGSEFVVRLPALAPVRLHGRGAPRVEERARRRRILIVEDNTDARQMLRMLLELGGHEVHDTPDGRSGLDAAAEVHPDIALIDIGLPGMDGYELARHLRQRDPRLHLVAVTGYGQPEDRRRALGAGFSAHLVKPVAPEELERVLAELE